MITVSVDSTFIRSFLRRGRTSHGGSRRQCRNCEWRSAGVQEQIAKAEHRHLDAYPAELLRAVGRTDDTEVTAFTDGCPGLRSILVDAGITTPPLPRLVPHRDADPARGADSRRVAGPIIQAGCGQSPVIVEEVERLRWRIWNGKAKNVPGAASTGSGKISSCMFTRMNAANNTRSAPSAQAVARNCLTSIVISEARVVGSSAHAKRYRAGLRVGTSITEGTANFLVNQANEQIAAGCAGPEEVLISCFRFAARSTMERSRLRIGPSISAACQPERAVSQRGVIPPFSGHSQSTMRIAQRFRGSAVTPPCRRQSAAARTPDPGISGGR